jgi:5S rRNA maturation endonuclease (ribonuclease M5)
VSDFEIICEGEDDKEFIDLFLKHLVENNIVSLNPSQNYLQYIKDKGGKTKLLCKDNHKQTGKRINNNKIKKVLFIFDADFEGDNQCDGLENSINCIEQLIKDLDWKIEIDYCIFDKNLDDVIIRSIEKEQCFKDFDKCLGVKNKNRKISTCIYKKLYSESPYDFSHKNFDDLKTKLTQIFA